MLIASQLHEVLVKKKKLFFKDIVLPRTSPKACLLHYLEKKSK